MKRITRSRKLSPKQAAKYKAVRKQVEKEFRPKTELRIYNIDKASEGGMGTPSAQRILRENNISSKRTTSSYVGMTALEVRAFGATHEKISKLLYG
jgi:hypothetical protein